MPLANRATERPARFQFTLRAAMIAVGVVGVVLGFTKWKGIPGAIGFLLVADLCVLAFAACTKRRRLAIRSGIGLLLPVSLAALYCFGPRSWVQSICVVCGKEKEVETFLGVTLREKEWDTELSTWYCEAGMRPHAHQWVHLCSRVQSWGGQAMNSDSFGFELLPLEALREISPKVDRSTFEDLAQAYYAMREDPTENRIRSFGDRCREFMPADDSTPGDP
jgi:hypothetical protein